MLPPDEPSKGELLMQAEKYAMAEAQLQMGKHGYPLTADISG